MTKLGERINPLLPGKAKRDVPAYTVKMTPKQREIKLLREATAAEAVGTLCSGIERYCVSKGQFSLIDFVDATINQTGPAHVIFSTWTAAGADLSQAAGYVGSGAFLSCRFLVDFTFHRRKPAFCGQLRNLFGEEAVRVTSNHAKFVIIRNEEWDVTIFTSANLNTNPRLEYFLIREDRGLAEFNQQWVEDLFHRKALKDTTAPSSYHTRRFREDV